MLRPFWQYYGGKWRAAPGYPAPAHRTIVEPFAGAAGYALRHHERRVILVEKYPVVAELWRYLICVPAAEVLRLPLVDCVHDLPGWVPAGARALVGFHMNAATTTPCVTTSSGIRYLRQSGRDRHAGWSEQKRARVAAQVEQIRHWRVIEGDYTAAPEVEATWFIDPPYEGSAGARYPHCQLDRAELADWVRARCGQVIACEAHGASWLPFRPHATFKLGLNGGDNREPRELIYTQGT